MSGAQIADGDTVILQNRMPKNRDIVAALIDGETTLKRYLVENGSPYLKAENPAYPNLIPAAELSIQGVMIGLLRQVP
jgi:repressor LexA